MITVSGLTKKYGDRTVVDDVSFTLEPGTVTGFLGPNGAGKTTTMRMITGLVPASAGSALVDGRPYAAVSNPGSVMGTLLDAGAVHPGRTGRTHLRLLADAIGVPASRVDEVLELVGLPDAAGRRIKGYSLGMRQRLGIAGALLADPPVLMFDEPANGLDPEGIRWMRGLLRGHAARGGTVLLSSHLLGEVEHTVDRLLVIGAGRIVADGPVASLLGSDGVSDERVDEVLALVGLTDAARRRIGGYSLGMQQRLGIAGALLADPPVLVFDEPANGLDPEGIRWMRDLLRGHAARGGTVLLSSHILSEVEHTVDRLLVIGQGRIVADGPVAELLGDEGTAVRAVEPDALIRDLEAAGFHVQHGADGVLVVPGTDPSQVGAVAAAGGHVLVELRPVQRGIEDLFFQLTTAS